MVYSILDLLWPIRVVGMLSVVGFQLSRGAASFQRYPAIVTVCGCQPQQQPTDRQNLLPADAIVFLDDDFIHGGTFEQSRRREVLPIRHGGTGAAPVGTKDSIHARSVQLPQTRAICGRCGSATGTSRCVAKVAGTPKHHGRQSFPRLLCIVSTTPCKRIR